MELRETMQMKGKLTGWLLGAAGLGMWLLTAVTQAAVELPSGKYHTTVEDLRVKVPGGVVAVKRTWYDAEWHFNRAWNPLEVAYDAIDGTVLEITRNGDVYKRDAEGSRFVFDERKSIVALEAGGFRWEDREGNGIEYDADGRVTRYADRNGIEVSLAYDAEGQRTGVFDHNGRQILWYEYADGVPSSVRDAADPANARTVQYDYTDGELQRKHLTGVTDARGKAWSYAYEPDTWQITVSGGRSPYYPYEPISIMVSVPNESPELIKITDPLGHVTKMGYSGGASTKGGNSRVLSITWPDETETTYGYDYDESSKEYYTRTIEPSGKVTERWYGQTSDVIRRDINGRTEYTMRQDGRKKVITDARGLQTVEHYDSANNLLGVDYPDGTRVSYTVDPKYSNVLTEVDENGVVTKNEYDDNGVVTKNEYDDNGNLIRKTEAQGTAAERVTEYVYDASGRLIDIKRLADANTALAVTHYSNFNAGDKPRTITDPEGAVHAYTFDNRGQVLSYTDPRGQSWDYTYDDAGHLLTITDPNQDTVTYEYDDVGNLKKRIGPAPFNAETLYNYDARGRLTSITDAEGGVTAYGRNDAGQWVKLTDASGRIVQQLAYDSEGHLTTLRDGAGNTTTYDYGLDDPAKLYPGQLNSVQYPTYSERYGYDKRDRITRITEEYDGSSRATFYTYDAAGNLDTVMDPKERTTDYDYDEFGRLKSELDPADGSTAYTYDDRDNLLSVTNARGVVIRRYEYDRNNRLTKEIRPDDTFYQYIYDDATGTRERLDAKGQKTRKLYDAAGRLATMEYYAAGAADPSKTVTFSYDERGLLTGYDDGTTSATYTYDLLGRKKTETVNYGTFTLGYSYDYDKAGRKTSFTGPDTVTVTYGYDDAGQPSTISLPGVGTFAYTEFRWQRPAKLTLPGGGAREWDYDGLMRPSQITGRDPAGNAVLDYSYGYDAVGNIESKTTEHGDYAYTYDELDRLTGADNPSLADETYTYDAVGNRKTDAKTSGEWTYSTSDELEGYDGVVLTYDDNGSLTQKDDHGTVTKYLYNLENRLAEVRDGADALIASYYYDPFGRRLWKEVGGTRTYFLYSDEGVIAEADAAGNVTRQYGWKPNGVWGTDPLYLKVAGETYFYQNDHLGTPQKLVGSNGAVVWAAQYESFGTVQIDSAQVENPLRFPGQYSDGETGLHYNYHRYYVFRSGSYIASDPIGLVGGFNLYAYVNSNPLVFIDPWGLAIINLAPPGSDAWKQGEAAKDSSGQMIVIAHSDYNGHVIGPDGEIMPIEDLADLIRNNDEWKDKMPVELRICASGSGEDPIIDQLKRHIPDSEIRGPIGDVAPNGWTYWPTIPEWGFFPSDNPEHWEIR